MINISQFLELIDAYAEATGLAESTISTRLFNDGKRIEMLRGGRDVGLRKAEDAVALLSKLWPSDKDWPALIPRPERKLSAENSELPSVA